PQKVQKVIEILIAIVVYAVLVYFFFSATKFVQLFMKTNRATPMLSIPYKYIYGIGPVSAVLMMISYTIMLVQKYRGNKAYLGSKEAMKP
ncbi:MAG: TRAP transporter small permease subunit, partial [Eubacteriales bacterium]|nr:TRAP transporter small permease subunit [Eubacteriales bacterium]